MGNNNIPFSSSLLILRTSRFHIFIPSGSEIVKKNGKRLQSNLFFWSELHNSYATLKQAWTKI